MFKKITHRHSNDLHIPSVFFFISTSSEQIHGVTCGVMLLRRFMQCTRTLLDYKCHTCSLAPVYLYSLLTHIYMYASLTWCGWRTTNTAKLPTAADWLCVVKSLFKDLHQAIWYITCLGNYCIHRYIRLPDNFLTCSFRCSPCQVNSKDLMKYAHQRSQPLISLRASC